VISSQVESPDDPEITANKEKQDSIRFNMKRIESRAISRQMESSADSKIAAKYHDGADDLMQSDLEPR
jgi:hypothetical protein